MGLKANICRVCGGALKNCGTYYKCICCDTEFRIEDSMTKAEVEAYFDRLNDFADAERNLSVSPPRFDEAESEFGLIVQKYPDWSAGYWGLVRAKFGIKFEQDLSGKAVPSCYKSSYEDFRDTDEYKKAVALAETPELRQSYEGWADYIARDTKEWREEAQKYDYDVFICFKASNDLDGSETRDAREMHKLYDLLKDKGYRVFFSPVTLITDGVVGKGSGPYIFNALDKAKALIVYGSRKEYFSSTWVQNEWQRYLRAIKAGKKEKDSLIVLYEGFNPKELPQGLRRIQGIEYGISAYPAVLSALERVFRNREEAARNREQELRRAEEEKRKAEQENAQKMQDMMAQLAAMQAELEKLKSVPSPMITKVEQNIPTAPQEIIKPQDAKKVVQAPIIEQKSEEFVIENGVLKRYRGFSHHVIIPDNVISIGEFAFSAGLESITIPNSVKNISKNAFYLCLGLTSVIIPDSVTTVGERAFADCKDLKKVTIGNGVTSIGEDAFRDCKGLENVTIGNRVTSIGEGAFYNCENLKEITIPNSVISIGDEAFCGCYNLIKAIIPNSVTEIGCGVFSECRLLTFVTMIGNSIISIEYNAFYGCMGLVSIALPDSLKIIGNQAFFCSGLTNITIPEGVTRIGDGAFSCCSNLRSVIISNSVESIGEWAFSECNGLASIIIPSSVTKIGDYAFENCNGLKKVSVPKETEIGVDAFPEFTKIERY